MSMLPNGAQAIDHMDLCLDLVRTAYLALHADSGLIEDDLEAIRGTLWNALVQFKPIREKLNQELAAVPLARDTRMHPREEVRS